ncbi:cellulase N-terminal Ig-like domain-containing protein [Tengunoibacter tsumagoiensis]|uniref:Cellulase Ig-like domain-containing protein n=1 Tax=Tengunoibacter tsumagoiensis TaxID=2014871 RepID=A0A402A6J5_9CHLR|nr:glycoside hydrolase family 9 protein [Tengunoibacter tsumagoiensis]GCE14635.1 hypothetical protein KTT_44940 [Tengunoibacter tsumagoiensis]
MDMTGLLYSQIGYDIKDPMRALIRSTNPSYVPEGALFTLVNTSTEQVVIQKPVSYWGELWKSSWWELDFSELDDAGTYTLSVQAEGKELCKSDPFNVATHLLWDETLTIVALDQMEERARLARNQNGWKDCGSTIREVNSHATCLIGLCDLMNTGFQWLTHSEIERLAQQLLIGCNYLATCQDKAEKLGLGKGSIVHEIPDDMVVIPGDVAQCVVAFARTSRLIIERYPSQSDEYLERAVAAYDYLLEQAHPLGQSGFSPLNHGASADFQVPDEWMTRDLLMMIWGGMELWISGKTHYKERVIHMARQVLQRQVPRDRPEGEFYGHFYTFDHCDFTEKANIHHHIGHDTGGTFPNYIVGLIEMTRRWYDDPEAPIWRKAVEDFAYGYFLPACSKNPFYLLPEGYFKGQGLLVFCGPWHGMNTSIAFTATLATKLETFTGDRAFRKISVGNLQWIAGLNAGITQHSFKGCEFWHEEIEPSQVIPYSQIYGIGTRYVGCWSDIRGSIPNGFSVNPQFQLTVEPTQEADGPWLFTDEDWIPHSAGWVSALTILREHKMYADKLR